MMRLILLFGNFIIFGDRNINNESARIIINTSENNTDERRAQYEAYLEWLNGLGITEAQLRDVLEYYGTLISRELIEYLQNSGYRFTVLDGVLFVSKDSFRISALAIEDSQEYLMAFNNSQINDESFFIFPDIFNETSDQVEQEEAYLEWLEEKEITEQQLKQLLVYYLENYS